MSYIAPTDTRLASLTKPSKVVPDTCHRCGGAGGSDHWPGWGCFRCAGSGRDPSYKTWAFPPDWTDDQITTFHTDREARNARARERAAAKRQAEAEAKRNEALDYNTSTYPDLVPLLDRHASAPIEDPFISDVLTKAQTFPLTEAQVSAVVKAVTELDATTARLDSTPDLPEGTLTLTGTVLRIKFQDSQWGGQFKLLLELDTGQRVYGTLPSAIEDVSAGDRISLDATVERSSDDRLFGFYKRPRNAQVLERNDA